MLTFPHTVLFTHIAQQHLAEGKEKVTGQKYSKNKIQLFILMIYWPKNESYLGELINKCR